MPAPGRPGTHESVRRGPWLALAALPLVALLFPAAIVLPGPLQSNGWPARLLIFWIAGAVILGWIRRPGSARRPSPVEIGCWILVLGVLTSFAAAQLRTLSDVEAAGTIRVALVLFPLAIMAIGIATLADVEKANLLLGCMVIGVVFSAAVAAAQFVSPFDLAEVVRPPGMVNRDIGGMGGRGGFTRVKGSATHPIEFGVISGAMVPVALHFARFGLTTRVRQAGTAATALLALAIPLSVTRSGVVTLAVAMAVYAMVLNARQRMNVLVLGLVGMVLMRAAIPGLLGTLAGFLLGASEDDSVTARLDDYPLVEKLFAETPVLGRGLGTFLPEEYFLLDNQYLMSLVEGGLIMVGALILFFLLALSGGRGAVHRADGAADESRAQAVVAAITGIAVSAAFFDLFSFSQVTVLLFLLVGVSGALWHHARQHGRVIPTPAERFRGGVTAAPRTGSR